MYKIYSLSSSEDPENIRYIGLTKNSLKSRLTCHFRDARKYINHRTNWINNVIYKKFNVIIKEVENNIIFIDDAKQKEIYYILKYKNEGFNLVNATDGGDYPVNDESVRKKLSELRKRKVDQYDLYGNFIKTFNSRNEASKELSIDATSISKCLKGIYVAGGFIFSYHGKQPFKIEDFTRRNSKRRWIPVSIKNIITNEIKYFSNISLASIYLKQNSSTTSRQIKKSSLCRNIYSIKYYNQCH